LIYLLAAIGLTPGGSNTAHIYTTTIHRTKQLKILVGNLCGIRTQSGKTKVNDELSILYAFLNRCTMNFNVIKFHSPANALFIKFEKALKFTLKVTLSLLLHVLVYDHHQGACARVWLKLY